jgi:hypothetical protein
MSKLYHVFYASLIAISTATLQADEAEAPQLQEIPEVAAELAAPALPPVAAAEPAPVVYELPVTPAIEPEAKPADIPFSPFTGKVKGRKVRLRLQPDLDSKIVKELGRNDLLTIVADKGDFWAVEAPAGIKAFVFRSYILDNIVEGNRVNIRLEPNLEASIIGHLNAGDKVEGVISAANNKWLEIAPPADTHFYVAKEFVEFIGGPEVKQQMDKRRLAAEQLLDASSLLCASELNKAYEEIDFDRIAKGYELIISDYTDFPDYVDQAREALTAFQEAYLHKQLTHLEEEKGQLAQQEENVTPESVYQVTDRMKLWAPIEQALYSSWSKLAENQSLDQYYDEQKLAAVSLSGILEPYNSPVKNKPGDYVIKDKDLPVGYVYSTVVNLHSLSGKQVKLIASPRPNNNFAFPAYFVLAVE